MPIVGNRFTLPSLTLGQPLNPDLINGWFGRLGGASINSGYEGSPTRYMVQETDACGNPLFDGGPAIEAFWGLSKVNGEPDPYYGSWAVDQFGNKLYEVNEDGIPKDPSQVVPNLTVGEALRGNFPRVKDDGTGYIIGEGKIGGEFSTPTAEQRIHPDYDPSTVQRRTTGHGLSAYKMPSNEIKGSGTAGLQAEFSSALEAINRDMQADGLGGFTINDGFRPIGHRGDGAKGISSQWGAKERHPQPGAAAAPGGSVHQIGLAADLEWKDAKSNAEFDRYASKYGVIRPLLHASYPEDWHAQLDPNVWLAYKSGELKYSPNGFPADTPPDTRSPEQIARDDYRTQRIWNEIGPRGEYIEYPNGQWFPIPSEEASAAAALFAQNPAAFRSLPTTLPPSVVPSASVDPTLAAAWNDLRSTVTAAIAMSRQDPAGELLARIRKEDAEKKAQDVLAMRSRLLGQQIAMQRDAGVKRYIKDANGNIIEAPQVAPPMNLWQRLLQRVFGAQEAGASERPESIARDNREPIRAATRRPTMIRTKSGRQVAYHRGGIPKNAGTRAGLQQGDPVGYGRSAYDNMQKAQPAEYGLHPKLYESLQRANADMAAQGLGTIRVTSGHRTDKEQRDLYQKQPQITAPPGQSVHQLSPSPAVDIDGTPKQLAWLRDNSRQYSLIPSSEPWHFSVMPEVVA